MKLTIKTIRYYFLLFFGAIALIFSGCRRSEVIPQYDPDLTNLPGQTYTLAGSDKQGFDNGVRTRVTFNNPNSIAIDAAGNLYVTDQANNAVRKITETGIVTTLAGSGVSGFTNGGGAAANFNNPIGIAIDAAGNLYVADSGNNVIRKITSNGTVTTFAGNGAIGFDDGAATAATFNSPVGIVIDHNGNLFVSDNHQLIREITSSGDVSTFAGKLINTPPGYADGPGADAIFHFPSGLAVDAANNIYVADNGNNMIRKITPDAVVTTVTGQLTAGAANGALSSATFNKPTGIAADASGNLYVADNGNNLIRKISASGQVTTVAGTGAEGGNDGNNLDATFRDIHGIALDASGSIYVADGYSKIRKIIPAK